MAAGKEINIKVKYIPDTSALKNIKEIKMPEIKVGGKDTGTSVFESYNNAVRNLNKELAKGTDSSAIIKGFKLVEDEASKVKTQVNSMIESINKSFQSPSNQTLIKDYQNLEKQLKSLEKESQTRRKKVGELTTLKSEAKMSTPQARKEIAKVEELVKQNRKLTEQEQARFEIAKQIVAKEEELSKLRTQQEIKTAQKETREEMLGPKFADMTSAEGTSAEISKLSTVYNQATLSSTNAAAGGKAFAQATKEAQEAAKDAKGDVLKFGDIISGTFLGTSLSNLFQTGLSKGIQFFKEYDETLTRTMMVTGQTREEVNSLTSAYNDLANQLSSTTKDVAAAQLVFYQQGLSTKEALAMTEASIAISKTGGIEAAEAADRLTAAVRGYQLAETEAMDLADKMSALDAAAASSVNELTVAMQKSASQARMAGLDLDYYMAYLSTMQEVTREAPENIGTAMKSITSRLQEITDIGKVEEDGTTFSNVAKALNSIGIAALDSSGQMRQLQDIMNELGPMWETLDRNHQAYIATVLAGNRQQSRFIALMDNYDRAMELVGVSQNAAGETSKQLRDYNTGLEASFTKLTNAWQQFATKVTDSSVIKEIIDFFTKLIEAVNKLPDGLVRGVTGFIALAKVWTTISKMSKVSDFSSWFGKVTGVTEFSEQMKSAFGDITNSVNKFKEALAGINNVNFNKTTAELEKMGDSMDRMSTSTKLVTGSMGEAAMTSTGMAGAASIAAVEEGKLSEEIKNVGLSSDGNDTSIKKEQEDLKGLQIEAKNTQNAYSELAFKSKEKLSVSAKYSALEKERKALSKTISEFVEGYDDALGELETRMEKEDPKAYDRAMKAFYKANPKGVKLRSDYLGGEPVTRDDSPIDYASKNSVWKQEYDKIQEEQGRIYNELTQQLREVLNKLISVFDEAEEIEKESANSLNDNTIALEKNTATLKEEQIEEGTGIEDLLVEDNKKTDTVLLKKASTDSSPIAETEQPKKLRLSVVSKDAIDKAGALKTKVGEITDKVKELNLASKAFSAITIGTMVSLAANYIPGVNDELAQTIGTFAGLFKLGNDLSGSLGKIFPKFAKLGAKGNVIIMAIEAAIYAGAKAWNYFDNRAEQAGKNLNESLDAWDKTSEAYTNMSKLISTYKELSGKINKTTEEQEQLNSAISELADKDMASKAVIGYDLQGNAILDTAKLDEAMNEKRIENAENANESVVDAVKKANADAAKETDNWKHKLGRGVGAGVIAGGSTLAVGAAGAAAGAKAGAVLGSVIPGAGNAVGAIVGGVIGAVAGTAFGVWSAKQIDEEIQRNAKAQALYSKMQEQSSTIVKGITEQSAAAISEGMEETSQSRQELAAYITKGSFDEFTLDLIKKQKEGDLSDDEIEELTGQYQADMNNAFSKLAEVGGLDKINEVVSSVQDELGEGATWSEVSSTLDSQLNTIFANAGIDDETADKLVSGIQSKIFANMSGNIPAMQAEVQRIIKEITEGGGKVTYLPEIKTKLGNVNQAVSSAISDAGLMTGLEEDGAESAKAELLNTVLEKSEELNEASIGLDGTLNKNGATVRLLSILYQDLGGEMDKVKGDAIDAAWASLESTVAPTFAEIATEVNNSIESFNNLMDVIEKLEETGGAIDLDTFTTLFNELDAIQDAAFSDFDNIGMYTQAFGQLADGISVVNGELNLQASAVQALADIQRLAFVSKMKQQLAEVNADIEAAEFERQMLEAEKKALLAGLAYKGDVAGASLKIESTLKSELSTVQAQWLQDESTTYANYVGMISKALNTAVDRFKKFQYAIKSGDFSQWENLNLSSSDVLSNITNDFIESTTKQYKSVSAEDFNKVVDAQIKSINKSLTANEEKLNNLYSKKNMLEGVISVAEAGNASLSKFSKGQESGADSASEYNTQLKKTLTLLEKISGIAHKLSENEDLKSLFEGWNGEKEAQYLLKNLELYEAQYEVQKELFKMQQEMTNQAAGDLLDSSYGELFKITESGDIGWANAAAYEKYKNLPGDMQEDIDELVSAFQEQRDELRDTESALQDYAKAVKEAREEIRDLTIEAEDTIVEALKNRESILHEARVKALEDEIDMIEKAVEARNKAREDEQSSKELYQAQEALRRATLDSSGKNNAQLLQLQQDLEDKQLEISEKRFEDDMDDRKQWLQDTKDAEDETYNYRLEKMTWYWEQVEEIMNQSTEQILAFLIQWNEEYRQESATQQEKLREQWEATFTKLKTITESLHDPIDQLKVKLSSVTTEVENMNVKVKALAGQWKAATAAKQAYANTSSGSRYSGGGGSRTGTTKTDGDDDLDTGDKHDTTKEHGGTIKLTGKRYNLVNGKLVKDPGFFVGSKKIIFSQAATFKDSSGKSYYKGVDGYMYLASDFKQVYKEGGYVDYTGPAWVDGTSSHPEAFLSAYQTEQIGALAKALDSSSINSATTNSNVTFGSINFNVASMSSAADGKKALDIFVQGANDMMAKKGIKTTLNLNVK